MYDRNYKKNKKTLIFKSDFFLGEINLIQIQLLFAIDPFSHERCDTVINAV